LRRACREWFTAGLTEGELDLLLMDSPLSDIEAAASALRKQAHSLPTDPKQNCDARNALLSFAGEMQRRCRKRRQPVANPQQQTSSSKSPPAPTPAASLSRAMAAIQRAKDPEKVLRTALDAARQLCGAASAIWWERRERHLLVATAARGLRIAGRALSFPAPNALWKAPASPRNDVALLSPDTEPGSAFLEQIQARRAVLVKAQDGRRWMGALSVHEADISEELVDLLLLLTQQTATVLRALESEREASHYTEEYRRSTADLGLALTSALTVDQLLVLSCQTACETFRADACLLFLSEDGEPLRLRAHSGDEVSPEALAPETLTEIAERTRAQPIGQPLWRTGERIRLPGGEALRKAGFKSLAGVNLPIRQEALGALLLLGRQPRAFTSAQRRMMLSFAAQSSVAIENLQLFENTQRRLLEMADLTWVSNRMASTLDADRIAAAVANAAAKTLNVPRVALFLANSEGGCDPLPGGVYGIPEGEAVGLPAEGHLGADVLTSGAPRIVTDAEMEGLADDALVKWMSARSLLCVPMAAQQGLRGILAVADERPRSFRSHPVALLSAYANQASLALQSALLYGDVVRHLNHLSKLFAVSQSLASSLELTDTLDAVLTSADELLDAPMGSVSLVKKDSDELVIKAARGLPDDWLYHDLKIGEGLSGRAVQSGLPLTSLDVTRDGRLLGSHRQWARDEGAGAAISAPLIARGHTVGVLNLFRRSPRPFSEDDKRLVMSLGNSAAVAIENAQLYEETRERAQFLSAMMSEINHRMRNSLQAIAGLLQMELERPDSRPPEEALKRGLARIQSVAIVHELMRAQEIHLVDVKQAARRIATLACETHAAGRDIETRISGAHVMLPSQRATSVALILGELIDNALRHGLAGKKAGRLSINLAEVGGHVVIAVRDNGDGLAKDFDPDSANGLGLKIVRGLVEKELGGTFQLEVRGGLSARAQFPKH
jgi:GAF domain-containing protein